MKNKDINNVYWVTQEINQLNNALIKLNKSNCLTETDKQYKKLLEQLQIELTNQKIQVEKQIDCIKDPRTRIVARMRFIELKTWAEITDELFYDKTTLQKLLKKI